MTSNDILQELLKRKAHIGNNSWNIYTSPFLLGFRSSSKMPLHAIINVEKTLIGLNQAILFIKSFKESFSKVLHKDSTFLERKSLGISKISKENFLPKQTYPRRLLKKNENLRTQNQETSKPSLHILIITSSTLPNWNIFHSFKNFGVDITTSVQTFHNKQHIKLTKTHFQTNFSVLDERWVGGTLTNWKQICRFGLVDLVWFVGFGLVL